MPACVTGLADGTSATSLVVCPSWGVPAAWAAFPLLPPLLPVNWQQGGVVAAEPICLPVFLFPLPKHLQRGLMSTSPPIRKAVPVFEGAT